MSRRSQKLRRVGRYSLGADSVILEERLVRRWHLNVGGHTWRCEAVSAGQLRQRDRDSHSESGGARDEREVTRDLILRCIAVLHTISPSDLRNGDVLDPPADVWCHRRECLINDYDTKFLENGFSIHGNHSSDSYDLK
jgi:hypothetical protein